MAALGAASFLNEHNVGKDGLPRRVRSAHLLRRDAAFICAILFTAVGGAPGVAPTWSSSDTVLWASLFLLGGLLKISAAAQVEVAKLYAIDHALIS